MTAAFIDEMLEPLFSSRDLLSPSILDLSWLWHRRWSPSRCMSTLRNPTHTIGCRKICSTKCPGKVSSKIMFKGSKAQPQSRQDTRKQPAVQRPTTKEAPYNRQYNKQAIYGGGHPHCAARPSCVLPWTM